MKINKKLIQRAFSMFPRFFQQQRLYGFSVALWCLLFPFLRLGFMRPYFAMKKHKAILMYLSRRYSGVLNNYRNSVVPSESNTIDPASTIWVSWWDGEEAMPDLVKVCYKTLRQHAGIHPVQLITKYNFKDYISIPDYILEKVDKKVMTVTHFSNMLRANLLYEYGGIWMDATILVLKDIALEDLPFYTLKAPAKKSVSVTLSRFAGIFDTSKPFHNKAIPPVSRWSGFLFAGIKNSPVFAYMRDILYAYWKDHNDQIDYLLYDYTIALGYDNISLMKKLIDDVPCSEAEKFVLESNLNTEYSEENFARYYLTPFHKLTWKKGFSQYTKDSKLTIYGYLLNTFL